ncbi:MAG: hypothetical protein V3V00_16170 [Saprospiraceae bacterium]
MSYKSELISKERKILKDHIDDWQQQINELTSWIADAEKKLVDLGEEEQPVSEPT